MDDHLYLTCFFLNNCKQIINSNKLILAINIYIFDLNKVYIAEKEDQLASSINSDPLWKCHKMVAKIFDKFTAIGLKKKEDEI
jgi:hypothetical protein